MKWLHRILQELLVFMIKLDPKSRKNADVVVWSKIHLVYAPAEKFL